jgi:hypothetical protein
LAARSRRRSSAAEGPNPLDAARSRRRSDTARGRAEGGRRHPRHAVSIAAPAASI